MKCCSLLTYIGSPFVNHCIPLSITPGSVETVTAQLNKRRQKTIPNRASTEASFLVGLAHPIANYAHAATGSRAPAMQTGYQAAVKLLGPRAYHLAATIPHLILNEAPLPDFRSRRADTARTQD